jgi:hypothetical protein
MHAADVPGVIEPGRLYTATEARQRLRLGDGTWRELKREGLRVRRIGRCCYVLGDDLIALLGAGGAP